MTHKSEVESATNSPNLDAQFRQPVLSDATILLAAPTQSWSRPNGDCVLPIDGIYHGDTRFLKGLTLSVHPGVSAAGMELQDSVSSPMEWISSVSVGPAEFTSGALLRDLDDETADPKLRLLRTRSIRAGHVRETVQIVSHLDFPVELTVCLAGEFDFTGMQEAKQGKTSIKRIEALTDGPVVIAKEGTAAAELSVDLGDANSADVGLGEKRGNLGEIKFAAKWFMTIGARATMKVSWSVDVEDSSVIVRPPETDWAESAAGGDLDGDLGRWVRRAAKDLDALRLELVDSNDPFFAAGAPWYLTLFGRDSIWSARLPLPAGLDMAMSTLKVLAQMQGTKEDPLAAEQPGKIIHEFRAEPVVMEAHGMSLPPRYYGTVDATPLWVCLLVDAWRAGAPLTEVATLQGALQSALEWIVRYGDGDGDGFVDYYDETGTGLANQGWKDSSDSIQWRDGTLAEGPLALCEVQGYAYEATIGGADLMEALADAGLLAGDPSDTPDPDGLRQWAEALKDRFRDRFWVTTPEGTYPAVALDKDGKAVDTLTSNIGHLLGTGILGEEGEGVVARLLVGESMASGFGIRTLSTGAAGYWPLSYHVGSVWAHDTAIAVRGLLRSGFVDEAQQIAAELVRAATGFGYVMPELYSGDSAAVTPEATPYPASCRPQAWSAAAAFTCQQALEARKR